MKSRSLALLGSRTRRDPDGRTGVASGILSSLRKLRIETALATEIGLDETGDGG